MEKYCSFWKQKRSTYHTKRNFAVEVGFYDDNDNLQKEKLIPLGNYIYDPMPSMSEQEITESLCSRSIK